MNPPLTSDMYFMLGIPSNESLTHTLRLRYDGWPGSSYALIIAMRKMVSPPARDGEVG